MIPNFLVKNLEQNQRLLSRHSVLSTTLAKQQLNEEVVRRTSHSKSINFPQSQQIVYQKEYKFRGSIPDQNLGNDP